LTYFTERFLLDHTVDADAVCHCMLILLIIQSF